MSTPETTGTMADLVLEGAERFGDGIALKHKDGEDWVERSYSDLADAVASLAKGLMALGLEKGDAVAIFADTRPEWVEADLGAACAGLVVATIYHTGSADEAEHVLDNSQAKLCFVENEELLEKVPDLDHLVLFEGSSDRAMSLDELVEKGEEADDSDLDARVEDIGPDDLFTLVYTSGTTGAPKGCMLTHGNFRAGLDALDESIEISEDSVFYAFLPLSHVLTRLIELVALHTGSTLAFWQRDKDKLLEDMREIQPTHLAAVPRIFEKIYNEAASKAEGGIKGKLLSKAIEVGGKVRELERKGESPGPVLKAEYELADKQIFSNVRDLFGGRLELALTGAAPVAEEMLEFFHACGVLVLEGYGLTETSGGATANMPDDFKFGTQGKALPNIEIKIAEPEARKRTPTRRARTPVERCSSAALRCSRATTATRRPPTRTSTPTAGSPPATSARSTTTASSPSPAGPRTSWSPRAARTSPPRGSRTRSPTTAGSPRPWSTATTRTTWWR